MSVPLSTIDSSTLCKYEGVTTVLSKRFSVMIANVDGYIFILEEISVAHLFKHSASGRDISLLKKCQH